MLFFLFRVGRNYVLCCSQGIVHRDIKPQNMLLSAPINDPSAVAKIADFGAAVFTCGIGKDKVSYGGTPHFQAIQRSSFVVI